MTCAGDPTPDGPRTAPIFIEDWYPPDQLAALAVLVSHTEGLRGAVIEVGCWEGRSTLAIAEAAEPSLVHAVDTWAGNSEDGTNLAAADRDVFEAFAENVRAAGREWQVVAHRMPWREWLVGGVDIRFLHIDAAHTTSEVRENIEAALDWMVPGGIICGDDGYDPEVARGVQRALGFRPDARLWWWRNA